MKHLIMLGILLRETGRIEGRKKFQKIVHILQDGGIDFDASFEFSRFGPYSADLKGWIDELVGANLVSEETVGNSYHYQITAEFEKLLSKVGVSKAPEWTKIAADLNCFESSDLEGISTIVFLRCRGWDGVELKERFASLKRHLVDNFDDHLREALRLQETVQAAA